MSERKRVLVEAVVTNRRVYDEGPEIAVMLEYSPEYVSADGVWVPSSTVHEIVDLHALARDLDCAVGDIPAAVEELRQRAVAMELLVDELQDRAGRTEAARAEAQRWKERAEKAEACVERQRNLLSVGAQESRDREFFDRGRSYASVEARAEVVDEIAGLRADLNRAKQAASDAGLMSDDPAASLRSQSQDVEDLLTERDLWQAKAKRMEGYAERERERAEKAEAKYQALLSTKADELDESGALDALADGVPDAAAQDEIESLRSQLRDRNLAWSQALHREHRLRADLNATREREERLIAKWNERWEADADDDDLLSRIFASTAKATGIEGLTGEQIPERIEWLGGERESLRAEVEELEALARESMDWIVDLIGAPDDGRLPESKATIFGALLNHAHSQRLGAQCLRAELEEARLNTEKGVELVTMLRAEVDRLRDDLRSVLNDATDGDMDPGERLACIEEVATRSLRRAREAEYSGVTVTGSYDTTGPAQMPHPQEVREWEQRTGEDFEIGEGTPSEREDSGRSRAVEPEPDRPFEPGEDEEPEILPDEGCEKCRHLAHHLVEAWRTTSTMRAYIRKRVLESTGFELPDDLRRVPAGDDDG